MVTNTRRELSLKRSLIGILIRYTAAISILGLSLGCSRKNEEIATVSIHIPTPSRLSSASSAQVQSASSPRITMLLVNVRGPSMPSPQFFTWDAKAICPSCSDENLPSVPSSVTFNGVQKGAGMLIQVMAVQGQGGSSIFYGENVKDLTKDNESVAISLATIGASQVEGSVAGRFLNTANTGPNGRVHLHFTPVVGGAARPTMKLFDMNIVNGWFNFFFIRGVNFSYKFNDGTTLFDGVTLDSAIFNSAQNSVLRTSIDPYYAMNNGNTVTLQSERKMILGYFGPGVTTQRGCFSPTSSEMNYAWKDASQNTPMTWKGTSPKADVEIGGVSGCGGDANSYTSDLFLRGQYLTNQETKAFGMSPPFRMISNSGSGGFVKREFVPGDEDTSPIMTLTWQYLPDTTGFVDGAEVYMSLASMNGAGGMGFNCLSIKNNPNYTLVGNEPFNASLNSTVIDSTDLASSGISPWALTSANFVVCAYKGAGADKTYFSGPITSENRFGSNGTPQRTLILYPNSSDPVTAVPNNMMGVIVSECLKYRLLVLGTDGRPDNSHSGESGISLSTSSGMTIWDTSDCSTTSFSGNIPAATSTRDVFIKSANATQGPFEIYVNKSNYNTLGSLVTFHGVVTGAYDATGINTAMIKMAVGKCYPLKLYRKNSGGINPTRNSTAMTFTNLTAPGGASFEIYLDRSCEENPATISDVTLGAGITYKEIYVKPTSTGSAGEWTLISTGSAANGATQTTGQVEVGAATISAVQYNLPSGTGLGSTCNSIELFTTNNVGANLHYEVDRVMRIVASNSAASGAVSFFTDSGCSALVGTANPLGSSGNMDITLPKYSSMGLKLYYQGASAYVFSLTTSILTTDLGTSLVTGQTSGNYSY
jgi:hypothetical protein